MKIIIVLICVMLLATTIEAGKIVVKAGKMVIRVPVVIRATPP